MTKLSDIIKKELNVFCVLLWIVITSYNRIYLRKGIEVSHYACPGKWWIVRCVNASTENSFNKAINGNNNGELFFEYVLRLAPRFFFLSHSKLVNCEEQCHSQQEALHLTRQVEMICFTNNLSVVQRCFACLLFPYAAVVHDLRRHGRYFVFDEPDRNQQRGKENISKPKHGSSA